MGLFTSGNEPLVYFDLDTGDLSCLSMHTPGQYARMNCPSEPYLNKWVTLRIKLQQEPGQAQFFADGALLETIPYGAVPQDLYAGFGASSSYLESGNNDTSFRRITVSSIIAHTVSVQSAPLPAPSQLRYTADIYRIDNIRYHLTVPRTDDWFDTGIPVVVDQEVNVYQANEQWRTNLSNRERFAVKLVDTDGASVAGPVGLSDWGVSLSPFTPGLPYDFLGSIKIKILSTVPVETFLVIVQDTNLRAGNCGPFAAWMSERTCPGYSAARQTAVSKASALMQQIPLR